MQNLFIFSREDVRVTQFEFMSMTLRAELAFRQPFIHHGTIEAEVTVTG